MGTLTERQLALIETMAQLEPRPCFMGGYAEDAVLAGAVTRPHADLDWLVPRAELQLRLEQAAALGFASFETWGESAPGEPFYLSADQGELRLELGIVDQVDGRALLRIHKLLFDVDGREPAAGYRIHLPADTFDHPATQIEGVPIRIASPLALYQLRAGIASVGSFGPLSERQQESLRQLRERFFPGRSEEELTPAIEPLPA